MGRLSVGDFMYFNSPPRYTGGEREGVQARSKHSNYSQKEIILNATGLRADAHHVGGSSPSRDDKGRREGQ